MSLPLLAGGFLVFLILGYRVWGALAARLFGVDDRRPTPAHAQKDGVDFVPTRPFYLFAQHFSAIAAAGPIAGPILACQTFGWLPCLLWVGLGVVFIGAVHDFSSLFGSLRHGGKTVAGICADNLGPRAGRALMVFIWLALVYVIVAFTDLTARTFVEGSEELVGTAASFHRGGAVAAASVLYLALAIVMGCVQRLLRPPLWLVTLLFVPAAFAVSWLGTELSHTFVLSQTTWAMIILAYAALASVTPVWALLQPRGYLGGFVLYAALLLGVIGVFFGGFEIRQPAFKGWDAGGATGALFPFLFVTIACGACSGFHGLVCSGTTSRQLDREGHARPIGYGAMLAEGFVALIALVTVMILAPGEVKGAAGTIYGQGIGSFLTLLIGEERRAFAVTFGAMAFSTFVFDTLDVCARLGRYLVQETFGWQGPGGAVTGTLLTVSAPALFLLGAPAGGYLQFWTLFGASNQLLAALTLLSISVWLLRSGRRATLTLLPMLFVLVMTLWALGALAVRSLSATRGLDVSLANGLVAVVLIGLALFLVVAASVAAGRAPRAMR